jgi:hypothetical protein
LVCHTCIFQVKLQQYQKIGSQERDIKEQPNYSRVYALEEKFQCNLHKNTSPDGSEGRKQTLGAKNTRKGSKIWRFDDRYLVIRRFLRQKQHHSFILWQYQ